MGRPPKVKEVVSETPEEVIENVKPETRGTLKKVFVLNINHKVLKSKTIKAGTRLSSASTDFYYVKQTNPGAFKQIQGDLFEITENVVVKFRDTIPCGTILDPIKDKDIFVALANVDGAIRETEGV